MRIPHRWVSWLESDPDADKSPYPWLGHFKGAAFVDQPMNVVLFALALCSGAVASMLLVDESTESAYGPTLRDVPGAIWWGWGFAAVSVVLAALLVFRVTRWSWRRWRSRPAYRAEFERQARLIDEAKAGNSAPPPHHPR